MTSQTTCKSRPSVKRCVQATNKENIRVVPLALCDWYILLTRGQWSGKKLSVKMSSTDQVILTYNSKWRIYAPVNYAIIGSNNGLSPGPARHQAIIGIIDGLLLIQPQGTNFSWILIEIFWFKNIHLKMSSGKRRPFSLGLNVLSHQWQQRSCRSS